MESNLRELSKTPTMTLAYKLIQQYNRCGGSIAKLVRLTAEIEGNPKINEARAYPFLLLDGLIADLTPWMQCGGHGTVSGIPNFAPAASMRLWELLNIESLTAEEATECKRLQAILSNADVAAVPGGIRAMSKFRFLTSPFFKLVAKFWNAEYALNKLHGYGVAPRKPLLPLKKLEGEAFMDILREMIDLEAEYTQK